MAIGDWMKELSLQELSEELDQAISGFAPKWEIDQIQDEIEERVMVEKFGENWREEDK